jgi:hypothetical protein
MDDGGVDRNTSLAWLREGIARADVVLSGASEGRLHWDRDAWGATGNASETTVYSLYDEQCATVVSTTVFRRALDEWRKFIETGSDARGVVIDLD